MKTLRKNIDLTPETLAVLQIEATLNQFGTLKPFLETLLENHAAKCRKARPKLYQAIVIEQRLMKMRKATKKRSGH